MLPGVAGAGNPPDPDAAITDIVHYCVVTSRGLVVCDPATVKTEIREAGPARRPGDYAIASVSMAA